MVYFRVFGSLTTVATTADCWSAHHKGYLGMTAHWINPVTREREKAVLACRRLKGRHTFDVIAQAMADIHAEFEIEDKVTRTTTDNGKNFVKAFVQFGSNDSTDFCSVNSENNVDKPEFDNAVDESTDEQDLEYFSFSALLSETDIDIMSDINLPTHMRCAAHTLNLVATKDADMALKNDSVFKKAFRAVMAKAQALWNIQNRSTVAADTIYAAIKRRLVVPNATRWNSVYDSVGILNTMLDTNRSSLQKAMRELKIPVFTDQDIDIIKEYFKVMAPVATALDRIQGKVQGYLGYLLPTITATIFQLENVKAKGLVYCNSLVDALLKGIDKRFGGILEDEPV